MILGKKGITLTCISGSNQNISWLYNGAPAPPCGIARCTLLRNGSLHLHKVCIEESDIYLEIKSTKFFILLL